MLKKLFVSLFLTAFICAAFAQVPAFDGGLNYVVVDSETISDKKFDLSLKVFDYADDEKIVVEFFGYGGKFPNEWQSLGTVTVYGFDDIVALPFLSNVKTDYTHYRYFAAKILEPTNRKFQFFATQGTHINVPNRTAKYFTAQDTRCLNFFILEQSTDKDKVLLPSLKDHPHAYEFDANDFGASFKATVTFQNRTDKKLSFTVLVYSQIKHEWMKYGTVTLDKYGDYKMVKAEKKLPSGTYRYFAIEEDNRANVICNISELAGTLFVNVLDSQFK